MEYNMKTIRTAGTEEYTTVHKAISELCKPGVAQFILDEDGNITAWLNPKAKQPTKAEIEAKVKEIETEEAISAKLNELKESYKKANQEGIAYMNTIFQADKESQELIVSVLSVGSVPTGFYWLDANNNKVPMTYEELRGLSSALLVRGQTNFNKLQGLKAQVNAASTKEELEQITW